MTAYRPQKVVDKPPDGLFDPAAVREHLTHLHEGRPFEIRAVRRRKGRVFAGYFDDVEAAVVAISQLLRRGGARDVKGWYTTLNPINPELLGRVYNRLAEFPDATTSDHDVTGYRHLLLDVDPGRPAETSSTDAQRDLALARGQAIRRYLTDELAWPALLYDAMTGNGAGVVYRTELLPNDPETRALFERCLKALQQRFGTAEVKVDETVFNPARITKVMGTAARKGDSTPHQPHRMAMATYAPAPGEVTRARLERLAATYPPPPGRPAENGGASDAPPFSQQTSGRAWKLEDVLDRSGIGYRAKKKDGSTIYQLDRCLTSEAHDDGAAIIEAAGGQLAYKCLHATCADKRWADAKAVLDVPRRPSRSGASPQREPPDDGAPHPAEGGFSHLGHPSVTGAQKPRTGDWAPGATLDDDPARPFSHFSHFGHGGSSSEAFAEAFAEVPELAPEERLSAEALVAAEATREAWLEPYIRAAEERYPMSPRSLHEAAGISALLTADARRHYVLAGHKRLYASAYLMFVAESGVSKSDSLNFMRDVLRDAGLVDLMLPAAFTAPALVDFLSLHLPEKVKLQGGGRMQTWLDQRRHGGVGSIIRDELVSVLDDCTKDYNGGLLPLLLKMAGAPDWVDDELTLARGRTGLERVGITILGATTPIALEKHAAKAEHWHNGLFSRFALIAPHGPIRETFWQRGRPALAQLPGDVVTGLNQVYVSAPAPSLVLEYEPVAVKGKGNGKAAGDGAGPDATAAPEAPEQRIAGVSQRGYSPQEVPVDEEAWAAWERYFYALRRMRRRLPNRLKSTYSRLHDHAIRLALALAVADWAIKGRHTGELAPALRLGHWAAAQQLTEAWRRDAHQILSEAIIGESTEARQAAGVRLIGYLERVKRESGEARLPRRDVLRALHLTAGALDAAIAAAHGAVREFEERTAGRPAQYLALATDAPDEEPPVTKATKAPQEEEAQVTEGSGGLGTDAIGAVTEAGLKVTKVPDARPTPGAAKVNGAPHALPDERDGFAVVPAAGGVAVAEDDPEEEDGTWTFSA